MSRSAPCANPSRCGVNSHEAGSAASRACARSSPAPPATTAPPPRRPPYTDHDEDVAASRAARAAELGRRLEATAADLRARLGAPAAHQGWRPGSVHPTGGYDDVVVQASNAAYPSLARVVVSYRHAGVAHRQDGPAETVFSPDGAPLGSRWMREGEMHNLEGPAEATISGVATNYSLDHRLVAGDNSTTMTSAQAQRRMETIASWGGAGAAHPVGWLGYEALAGRKHTRALVRAGVDGKVAYECAREGVLATAAIVAVGTRRAPASWVGGRR